jgi:hypothetical protein
VTGPTTCFLLSPIDRCVVSFRRYSRTEAAPCPAERDYHNASVVIAEEVFPLDDTTGRGSIPDGSEKSDPRWPARCDCGYQFTADDHWQVNRDRLHSRSDGGPPCTLRDAPPGAMWDAHWMGRRGHVGPDGRFLVVRTPDGSDWQIDGRSFNADRSVQSDSGWTRTGEAPRITARPSILFHHTGYHAFLTDGVLVPC